MQFIENIILKNINKDVSPSGLDYSGRKIVNPLRDLLNSRVLSSEEGDQYLLESIRGTQEVPNSQLSAGLNECIGTYENIEQNLMIFFIWNSNLEHGVFKYNGTDDTITRLLVDNPASPVLNFSNSPRYAITGVGMIGNILTWTDNLNPQRYMDITRTYTVLNALTLSLAKIGPRTAPSIAYIPGLTPNKNNDTSQRINKIADLSFQFAFKYVYVNNEESVLSPFSELVRADAFGIDRVFTNARNYVTIAHTIDTDISTIIKRVECCFRINNNSEWIVWSKVTNFGASFNRDFYNDSPGEIVPTILSSKLFDAVPNLSKALAVFKNRIFLNITEEGLTVPSLTVTPSRDTARDTLTHQATREGGYLKKNGSYSVGVVVTDAFGRMTGVYSKKRINGEELTLAKTFLFSTLSASDPDNRVANRLAVALTGSLPPSSRYSIVVTPELKYEVYMQTVGGIAFYVSDTESPNSNAENVIINGRRYVNDFDKSDTSPWSFCHIFLPDELPFIPDKDCYVRIINSENTAIVERVLDVIDGNIIVTGKFPGIDFTTFPEGPRWTVNLGSIILGEHQFGVWAFIEIFKLKTTPDIFYYEVAGPFQAGSDGAIITTPISNIEMDTYYRGGLNGGADANRRSFRFRAIGRTSSLAGMAHFETEAQLQIETPSPTYISGTTIPMIPPQGIPSDFQFKGYTPDYSKTAWSRGRVFVELTPEVLTRPCTLRFSDPFIEGSTINGLTSFPVDNIYDKIGQDRSPITKLVPVGNIMLAVHERAVTSLYIGEAIVRSGDGGLTAKVDAVIGDDRKLETDMGSYHPESVQEIDGKVFGWDIFSGQVWRYTVEGLIDISSYGMSTYFRDRGRRYFEDKDRLKFVSGIDKDHKEYLLTLPPKWDDLATAPVQASGPSSILPGTGMQPLADWSDAGHEWSLIAGAQVITENGDASPPSPWVKGTLISVPNYTYNFSLQFQIQDDLAENDCIVEVALLDATETVLDSVSFNISGASGTSNETLSLQAAVAGTHVGVRFNNNTVISSKTILLEEFVFDTYETTANSALTYDFVLNPLNYVLGETYRFKVIAYKQGATANDEIDISIYGDGLDIIEEHLDYTVSTAVAADAEELLVQFIYTGQSFIRVNIIGIDFPIFVALHTESQTITGETWAFNYEENVWAQRYSFVPEFMGRVNTKLVSFKEGRLWRHNVTDTHNNFYGVQYQRQFTFATNPQPNKVKVWSAVQIAAESLAVDEAGQKKILEVSNTEGQASYTRVKDFDKKEGVYYGYIFKDVNTNPALLQAGRIALRDGKDMRSKALEVTVSNDRTDVSRLQKINIIGEYSEFSI